MRRTGFVLFALVALLAVTFAPAFAVTDGEPDAGRHPYVGMMVALDENSYPLWRCSGTLLSSSIFLTAGHCTEAPADHVEIWFAEGPVTTDPEYREAVLANNPDPVRCDSDPAFDSYPCKGDVGGTPYTHPNFNPNAFYLFDLGVVQLDRPYPIDGGYGQLPTQDRLDTLKTGRHTTFTSVGYGLQSSFPDAASWKEVAIRQRMVAYPHLIQINKGIVGDFSLLLSNNASTGGTCFGDSGGPNFIGDTRIIAGVTSFGMNPTCAGTGGVYRVDRADDLGWLYAEFGDYLP